MHGITLEGREYLDLLEKNKRDSQLSTRMIKFFWTALGVVIGAFVSIGVAVGASVINDLRKKEATDHREAKQAQQVGEENPDSARRE